jgi:hypothetical protein
MTATPWLVDHWVSAAVSRFGGIDARRVKLSEAEFIQKNFADLPAAASNNGKLAWVLDQSVVALSDGSDWRRLDTNAVLS